MMSSACVSLSGNALSVKTRELQGKLEKKILALDSEESDANVSPQMPSIWEHSSYPSSFICTEMKLMGTVRNKNSLYY